MNTVSNPPADSMPSTPTPTPRYFGLDSVRSVAMLLGVLYHALLFGGDMMSFFGGGTTTPSVWVMHWIHSFRMPLFFLIAGFFSHLMVGKYGWTGYLLKRWWRLGIPFLVVLFALAGIKSLVPQPGFGGPPGGGRPGEGGPPPWMRGAGEGRPPSPDSTNPNSNPNGLVPGSGPARPTGNPFAGGPQGGPSQGPGEMPPPPPGVVPPFLSRFDTNTDGTLDDAEWKKAREEMGRGPRGPGGPGGGPDGGPRGPGGPGGPGGRGGPGFPGMGQGNPIAEKLFGSAADRFRMQHLWFLWYVIVFASAAPLAAWLLGRVASWIGTPAIDRLGHRLLGWGLGPLILAVASLAGLYLSAPGPGQPPGGMATIFGIFPDVLLRYDPDWPYFFTYFLFGWWLFRMRDSLGGLSRHWLPVLAVGFAAYVGSTFLPRSMPFGPQPEFSPASRFGGYLLFAVAVSHMGVGLMGFFQRYLDVPNRLSRYLADTAFWVYLVHQDLLTMLVLDWTRPWGLPAFASALAAVAITVAISLVAFEILVRRTPLTRLFGPPPMRKPKPTSPPA
jgi:fucose 4-O-acetylase-like acetyltransferase